MTSVIPICSAVMSVSDCMIGAMVIPVVSFALALALILRDWGPGYAGGVGAKMTKMPPCMHATTGSVHRKIVHMGSCQVHRCCCCLWCWYGVCCGPQMGRRDLPRQRVGLGREGPCLHLQGILHRTRGACRRTPINIDDALDDAWWIAWQGWWWGRWATGGWRSS